MFQKNEYSCFTYTNDNGEVDIADGIIVDVKNDSVVIDYNNVHGPATRMRIGLSQIGDIFDPVFVSA